MTDRYLHLRCLFAVKIGRYFQSGANYDWSERGVTEHADNEIKPQEAIPEERG